MTPKPEQFVRRGPVYRKLKQLGAVFGEFDGGACALGFGGDPAEEEAGSRELALMDFSAMPRSGYRGPQALPWLQAQKLVIAPENNRGAVQREGGLAARLSDGEVLLLGNLRGNRELLERLEAEHSRERPEGVYRVHREDSSPWFLVSGRLAPEMLAKLCGVDLSPRVFPPLEVAQTSVARAGAIVVRWDLGPTLAYHLLPGAALAEFLWDCLMDAMVEYGGRPAGLEAAWSLLAADQ